MSVKSLHSHPIALWDDCVKFLKNGKVQEKLKAIVLLVPNHISARLLYLESIGKAPAKLSLPGSLSKIEKAAGELGAMLVDGRFLQTMGDNNVLFKLANEIAGMRSMLDQRTLAYCDSYSALANYVKTLRGRSAIDGAQIDKFNSLLDKIISEREKLRNNQEIREELMLE